MPRLTVKALAEFADKGITDQMRILAEQKRPQAGAAPFKTAYYQAARTAITHHYRQHNDPKVVHLAVDRLWHSTAVEHKRLHNIRVLQAFSQSPEISSRHLQPLSIRSYTVACHGVDMRLTPDLLAKENGTIKYILFNFTNDRLDETCTRRTLELMRWHLGRAGHSLAASDCEIIDLTTGAIHVNDRPIRKSTIKNAEQNLQAIAHMWTII